MKPILCESCADCATVPLILEVANHKDLIAAELRYGRAPLVHYIVKKPLTASQLRRLPVALRERIAS